MQAAIAAYPQLGNFPDAPIEVRETWGISDHVLGVSDEVFDFLRDVLTQVSEIFPAPYVHIGGGEDLADRSEEHTSELQSRGHLVCRLLLEKKNKTAEERHTPQTQEQQAQ